MKKNILAFAILAVIAAPALAADTSLYAGVKLGSANKSVPGASETNSAFGFFGGYTINPNFAVEVGYTDLGTVSSGIIKFTALDVSAVGTYPINDQFSVYGKLGLASTKEEALSISASRSDVTYGLGGQFNVNQSVGIRLGYDHYGFGDDVIYAKGDISLYSVAGVFKF